MEAGADTVTGAPTRLGSTFTRALCAARPQAAADVAAGRPLHSSDTVCFQVVDAEGNCCSFINSNYMGFGSGARRRRVAALLAASCSRAAAGCARRAGAPRLGLHAAEPGCKLHAGRGPSKRSGGREAPLPCATGPGQRPACRGRDSRIPPPPCARRRHNHPRNGPPQRGALLRLFRHGSGRCQSGPQGAQRHRAPSHTHALRGPGREPGRLHAATGPRPSDPQHGGPRHGPAGRAGRAPHLPRSRRRGQGANRGRCAPRPPAGAPPAAASLSARVRGARGAGVPEAEVARLRAMGHRVDMVRGDDRAVFGRGQIIARDPTSGVLAAGSDGRADGCAMGW